MFASQTFLRSLVAAALIALVGATGIAGASTSSSTAASPPVDIEIAVDTTGSMAPSVRRAQALGDSLVAGLFGELTNARVAVVEFRDPGNPAGEYELLQPMTADPQTVTAAIAKLKTSQNPSPGNVAEESYNLAFHNSYAESALGWRRDSRKVVVVIGDAEPFGAGKAGIAGCRSTTPDPHGFNTATELAAMRKARRTLVFIRAVSPATSTSLACYRSMAARAYPAGTAIDDTAAGNLSTAIEQLVDAGLAPLRGRVTPLFPRPGSSLGMSFAIANPNPFALTVRNLVVALPSGLTLGSGQQQWQVTSDGRLQLSAGNVPVRKNAAFTVKLSSRSSALHGVALATLTVVLPDGNAFDTTSTVPVSTGRLFRLRFSQAGRAGANGSFVVAVGRRAARGAAALGRGHARWRFSASAASLTQSATVAHLALRGSWKASSGCAAARGTLGATLRENAAGGVRLTYSTTRRCGARAVRRHGTVPVDIAPIR